MNIYQSPYSGNQKKDFTNIVCPLMASDLPWRDAIKLMDKFSNLYFSAERVQTSKDVINNICELQLSYIVGREVACELRSGNICICYTVSSNNSILSIEIINFFLSQKRPFEIIKGSDFVTLSNKEKSNTEIQYLIQIDINNASYMEIREIVSFCKANFICKIPGLKLNPKAEIEDEWGLSLLLCAFLAENILIKH
jgi:hypothetical protein